MGEIGELGNMSAAKFQKKGQTFSSGQDEYKPSYAEKLENFWKGDILWNCSLAYFSTFKVGGPAEALIMPTGVDELSSLVAGLNENNIPWRVIGRGSNILVPDEGYPGVVIVLGKPFSSITKLEQNEDQVVVQVDAGCSLTGLVKWTLENSLAGLEFASGIPGSIGGALLMNAGAFGGDMSNVTESILVMDSDGNNRTIPRQDCQFSYRKLLIRYSDTKDFVELAPNEGQSKENAIILAGVFRFRKAEIEKIKSHSRDLIKRRKAGQPHGVASAGSFFKNPSHIPAGRLIEDAGLKGLRVGGAVVSQHHANFIVNAGGATAGDIVALMELVQEKVWSHSGIMLEPEVDVWAKKDGKHH